MKEMQARWDREEQKRQKELLGMLKTNMGSMSEEEIEACNRGLTEKPKFCRPSDTEK